MTQHLEAYGLISTPIRAQVGVPAFMLDADTKAATISAMNDWIVGEHAWTTNGNGYHITVESIEIKSQAIGALFDYAFAMDGTPDPAHYSIVKKDVGIVSIGYNTVELAGVSGGNTMIGGLTGSDMYGVRRLLEALDGGDKTRLGFIDLKLRNRSFNGELTDAKGGWAEQVQGYIGKHWGKDWKKLGRILVVGGGATSDLLRRELELFFVGKAYIPDDPILSIARGLYKRGVGVANRSK